jgi:hypothetical protein
MKMTVVPAIKPSRNNNNKQRNDDSEVLLVPHRNERLYLCSVQDL